MSERPLNHQDIAGTAVKVGGESVPQTVGTDAFVDPCFAEPVPDAVGDLPGREARATVGEEQRLAFAIALALALHQVGAQKGAQCGF